MKRKKGEDGGEFDVFGEDEANGYGAEALESEGTELYDDDLEEEEEFDEEESDFDEDFEDDDSLDEGEGDFDELVDDDE